MARKKTTSEEKKTVLLIPLTEARSRISEQIEKGRELFAIRIMTERQLREAQTKYKIWSDVTRDLLKRKIFNTDELAEEFQRSTEYISVLRVTATIEELVEDFHKGPHQSLDTLISIRERLDLFPVISTQQEGSEPNIDLDIKREELGSLKKQLYQRTKILMRLKEEEAKIGFDRKLYIQITDEEEVIEEIQKHIQELEAEIKERERIEEQLPITIGTSEKPKAHSVKRQRDLKILRSIFENIYTPALDMFFRHARMGYVPDNIFFFKYGVEHFVTSSNFLIYDKVLEQRIKDFYSAWSYTLDFGHIFQPSLNSNRFILIEPDENPWLVDDYPKFFEAVELAEQRYKELIKYVKEEYLEIDTDETDRIAYKAYKDFHEE